VEKRVGGGLRIAQTLAMNPIPPNQPPKPVITRPPRHPERRQRATPGFGEDGVGERVTKRVSQDTEKPELVSEL
jgi:hypothetical protein